MPIRGSTHILRNILAGTAQAIQMAAGRMHCWLHSRSDCKAACSVARPVDVLGSQGSVRCVFCRTTSAMSAPDGRASSAAVESDRHSPFRTHTLTYSIDLTCCLCLHMRRTTSATSRRSSSRDRGKGGGPQRQALNAQRASLQYSGGGRLKPLIVEVLAAMKARPSVVNALRVLMEDAQGSAWCANFGRRPRWRPWRRIDALLDQGNELHSERKRRWRIWDHARTMRICVCNTASAATQTVAAMHVLLSAVQQLRHRFCGFELSSKWSLKSGMRTSAFC